MVASLLCLFGLSWLALGEWLPPFSVRGLWFYSGAFAFLTGSLLDAPTHVVPKQAFQFSAVALIATLSAGFATSTPRTTLAAIALGGTAFVLMGAIVASLVAMWWKDERDSTAARAARTGFVVGQYLGTPAATSTVFFLYLLVSFHLPNKREALVLVLGWTGVVLARPLERTFSLINALITVWSRTPPVTYLGEVVGHNVPGIVTLRHSGAASVHPGTPLVVRGDDGTPNVALSLSYIGYSDGPWLRALQLDVSADMRRALDVTGLPDGACALLRDRASLDTLGAEPSGAFARRDRLIGLVVSDTDRITLHFEVLRFDANLHEGKLVTVRIGTQEVLYQVLNGLTQDEIVQQRNTRGYVVASARKIGSWSDAKRQFVHVPWVPAPNTPVFLEQADEARGVEGIGVFPGTHYPISLGAHDTVTHNTAVIGILGVGKTFAVLELVERVLRAGTRVICLDMTEQYAAELDAFYDSEWHASLIASLQSIGKTGKTAIAKNVEEGGSVRQFEAAVRAAVRQFLDTSATQQLLVLNPNAFEVWRQDSKPYQNDASMASLSAAEITRIVSEAALDACQELGMTTNARCCLVYEEAHSLVPEFSAVAVDGDKTASNGSARAILQGRKFGLGCIVVTQRTASVTKTILNQCNTIIAMRTFDATGMDFLSNYIGRDYASLLSALPDRHGVVFGKASSCSDPVVVRFNDRDAFLAHFRGETRPEVGALASPGTGP